MSNTIFEIMRDQYLFIPIVDLGLPIAVPIGKLWGCRFCPDPGSPKYSMRPKVPMRRTSSPGGGFSLGIFFVVMLLFIQVA